MEMQNCQVEMAMEASLGDVAERRDGGGPE